MSERESCKSGLFFSQQLSFSFSLICVMISNRNNRRGSSNTGKITSATCGMMQYCIFLGKNKGENA